MTDPAALHADAIVIDATCPLTVLPHTLDWYREGGCTAIAPTLRGWGDSAREGFAGLGAWLRRARERDDLAIVRRAADIEAAKRDGRLGLVLHFQGTDPVEGNLDYLDAYAAAGVRVVQLAYNTRNRVGDGAAERTDSGLSTFGLGLIARCNALRLVVDCAHTGRATTLEAIEASTAPTVISHANARAVHETRRNVDDDVIRAIAAGGGVVGTVGFPAFLTAEGQPGLDRFIDDIAYKADLVGIDHVGLGIDYFAGQWPVEDDAAALARWQAHIDDGSWRREEYPPPPYRFPAGIETPRTLPALTRRLVERGFAEPDVRKVLGLNWLRVWRAVWGE